MMEGSKNVTTLPAIYEYIARFALFYQPMHAAASVILSVLGTICNSCTIVVLSRPRMRNPVNAILVAMAVSNNFMVISFFIFTSYAGFVIQDQCDPRLHSYWWAVFVVCHAQISLVAHSSSVWFSVCMAVMRIKVMRSRCARKEPVTVNAAKIAIFFVATSVVLLNLPNCLIYSIRTVNMEIWKTQCKLPFADFDGVNETAVHIPLLSDLAVASDRLLMRIAFWITGCAFKILPCIVLPILIFWLTNILAEVSRRRARLYKLNSFARSSMSAATPSSSKTTDPNRTTRMLILIVCVFLVTELPQGAMAILSGLMDDGFLSNVYKPLADLMDLLALMNSCSTFVIYCTMSELFRQEARETFCPSQVAQQYTRVEHRQSIVPDTPLFAALKATANASRTLQPGVVVRKKRYFGGGQHEEQQHDVIADVVMEATDEAEESSSTNGERIEDEENDESEVIELEEGDAML